MALTKTIEIDGKQVTFRASAAIPRLYRIRYRRDIMRDLHALAKAVEQAKGENPESGSTLDYFSLELFENIAHCMAHHADPQNTPDTPDEWLEQFNVFSIYQVLPQLLELWGMNLQQDVESKKKLAQLSGS
jgi:hypothetical protein